MALRHTALARAPWVLAVALACSTSGSARESAICANGTGTDPSGFHTFFRDGGAGCMALGSGGRYSVAWSLGASGNLVAGRGWAKGFPGRNVHYTAHIFDPGANGYLTLYGWSTDPLVEYYVVEHWGAFTPPGEGAVPLGTVSSDGGTYRIYRTRRVEKPSILGTATFDQFWSVRTTRRATGPAAVITFANHVQAWRRLGLKLGRMNYQVMATEGFGSTGRSDITVHTAR